jgi:hypothetical protein
MPAIVTRKQQPSTIPRLREPDFVLGSARETLREGDDVHAAAA